MRRNMKEEHHFKYDPTASLKQFKSMPQAISIASLLMILIMIMFPTNYQRNCCSCPWVEIPEAVNDHYIDPHMLTIFVKKSGEIYLAGRPVTDFKTFPGALETEAANRKSPKDRIRLKIDRDAPFGAVQKALRAAREVDVKIATFVTVEHAAFGHFLKPAEGNNR